MILLGNYFSSIEDLKEKCPDLYNLLPSGKTEKEYYLDTTVATSVQSSIQTYTSTYYYFE